MKTWRAEQNESWSEAAETWRVSKSSFINLKQRLSLDSQDPQFDLVLVLKFVSAKAERCQGSVISIAQFWLFMKCSIFVQCNSVAVLNNGEDKLWFCECYQLWFHPAPVLQNSCKKPQCWWRVVSFGGPALSYFLRTWPAFRSMFWEVD